MPLLLYTYQKTQGVWKIKLSLLGLLCWKKGKKIKITPEYKVTPTTDDQLTALHTNPFLQPLAPICSCHLPSASRSCICCCKFHKQAGLRQVPAVTVGSRSASINSLCSCNNQQWLFPLLRQKAASCFILKGMPSKAIVFPMFTPAMVKLRLCKDTFRPFSCKQHETKQRGGQPFWPILPGCRVKAREPEMLRHF